MPTVEPCWLVDVSDVVAVVGARVTTQRRLDLAAVAASAVAADA